MDEPDGWSNVSDVLTTFDVRMITFNKNHDYHMAMRFLSSKTASGSVHPRFEFNGFRVQPRESLGYLRSIDTWLTGIWLVLVILRTWNEIRAYQDIVRRTGSRLKYFVSVFTRLELVNLSCNYVRPSAHCFQLVPCF